LCFSLRKENFLTGCITVKLRYSNFDTQTKQCSFLYTSSDEFLMDKVTDLFEKLYNKRMLVRLIGVRLTDLVRGNYQISLFDDPKRSINLYQAMDKIRAKHGEHILGRAV
ncbi:MAG: DNA polymerase IV, partial [Cytophagaceae bacterium]|nr:DNA polymerase IV [Cytophagaceae bacterium]